MRIRSGVAAVLTTLLTVVGATGSGVVAADVTCRPMGFGGEGRDGQVFEYPLKQGSRLPLAPERQSANPPGWRIEVRSRTMPGPENEFSWVVSPPYRFWNPRYLDTSYGWSARDSVQFGKREFSFVVTEQEYRAAAAAVRKLLWPAGLAEGELEDARQTLASVRRATGSLVVLDSRVDERAQGPHGGPGRIEWIRFAVVTAAPLAAALVGLVPGLAGGLVGLGALGFALAPIYPLLISLTPARVGAAHATHAVGFQVAAAYLGAAALPGAAGVLAHAVGLEVIGPFMVVTAIAVLGLHEAATRRERDRRTGPTRSEPARETATR